MKKTMVVAYPCSKIPGDVTDIVLIYNLYFKSAFIRQHLNFIKYVINNEYIFWRDSEIPSKYIIIDDNYNKNICNYIHGSPNAYHLLKFDGNPVILNKNSMISLKSYRNLPDSDRLGSNLRALELWDQIVQFPEFLPKLDQIPGDCRFLFRK